MADFDLNGSVRAGQGLLAPVAELMQRLRQNETDSASSDALAQMAVRSGLMPHEEYEQYQTAPLAKKKGIVGTLAIRWSQRQQEQAQQQRAEQERREGIPRPLVLPDGSVVPGRYYIPGARSVIDTNPRPQTTAPPLGHEVIPGFIWNGRTLIPKSGKGDEIGQLEDLNRTTRTNDLNREIAKLEGELAGGNERPGPDWMPWVTTPYAARLKQLRAERDALIGPSSPQLRQSQQPPAYADPGAIPPTASQSPSPLSPTTRQAPAALPNAAQPSGNVLNQARDAIGRGAPREAVIARLRQMGIDPAGL